MLAPVLAAIVIAYLLEGLVRVLVARGLPRLMAVLIVFIVFLCFVAAVLFGLLPLVSKQTTQLVQQIPAILGKGHEALLRLPELYPEILSVEQIDEFIGGIGSELTTWGQTGGLDIHVVGHRVNHDIGLPYLATTSGVFFPQGQDYDYPVVKEIFS